MIATTVPPALAALALHLFARFVIPGGLGLWFIGWVTALGALQGVALVACDLVLAALGWRALPSGTRAWLVALAAPPLTFAVWWLAAFVGHPIHLATAMFVVAAALRLAFGARR